MRGSGRECCAEMIGVAIRRAPGTCEIEIAAGSAAEERTLEVGETSPVETDRADCK